MPHQSSGPNDAEVFDLGVRQTGPLTLAEGGRDGFAQVKALALDAVSSPHTRRAYDRALTEFLVWYRQNGSPGLTKAVVQRYRSWLECGRLATSSINIRLSALRRFASEAADNALLPQEIATGILKVKGLRSHGVRAGNWLSAEQATALINVPNDCRPKGARDRAILALLIGCGLRRAEIVSLDFERIEMRDSRWVIPDLKGKGNRIRTIPVPTWTKVLIDEWARVCGRTDGPLFPPVNKAGFVLVGRVSEDTIRNVVRRYGSAIGQPHLAPHDLRRTCAKLCRASGGELEQIQLLLGHASVQTTERYLGTRQNLISAVNDNLPVSPALPVQSTE